MITIKKLTKHILGEPLFEEVSFVLNKGDKVGLVGPNGSGKSTLLKILLGEVESDGGKMQIENERIGYLSQELPFKEDETVRTFLSIPDEAKLKIALDKVGLDKVALDLEVRKLSGGQKTRLSLAKILINQPTVLLLDEPTNHLDWRGLEWLEKFISDFRGAVLIVSHDRKLLDNSVNKILEIDAVNHRFNEYVGGYTEYALEKEKKLEIWEEDYRRQQRQKRKMELWLALKRQEAHVHPDPAKGKQIRAMEKRIQREIHDNEIKKPRGQKKISVDLKGETATAKLILKAKDITKSFPDKRLLWKVGFELRGKEHILLAGNNGSGKTTLIKIITGKLLPDSGEFKLGEKVRWGYFAQEHEDLDLSKTVMEEFLSTERLTAANNARAILGSFLFSGQSAFKKVSGLSLGERVRLIFAKLTNQENELLILDEPTNHLDIQSREVIEDALIDYKGAILVISHDRYFLDKISINRILTIQNGEIKESLPN